MISFLGVLVNGMLLRLFALCQWPLSLWACTTLLVDQHLGIPLLEVPPLTAQVARQLGPAEFKTEGGETYVFRLTETNAAVRVPRYDDPALWQRFSESALRGQRAAEAASKSKSFPKAGSYLQAAALVGRLNGCSVPYSVEPWLGEQTLETILMTPSHPLRTPAVLKKVLFQLSEALGGLHESGWVHRDVTPANILVDADGDITLIDPGLLTPIGENTEGVASDAGSPGFRSRDQQDGKPAQPHNDFYAVGQIVRHFAYLLNETKSRLHQWTALSDSMIQGRVKSARALRNALIDF